MTGRFRIFNTKTGETIVGSDVESMDVDDVGFEEFNEPEEDDDLEFVDDSDLDMDDQTDSEPDLDMDDFDQDDDFEIDDVPEDDLEFDVDDIDSFDSEQDEFSLDDESQMDDDPDLDMDSVGQDTDVDLESDGESLEDDELEDDEDEDYQGNIRTVKGAHLVYKRMTEDGTYDELWIYNVGKNKPAEQKIRNAILAGAGTGDNMGEEGEEPKQPETYTVGNVQYIKLTGVPN